MGTRTTIDIYAVVTLEIDGDEHTARKALHDGNAQEMHPDTSITTGTHPDTDTVALTNNPDLPVRMRLTSLSYRKVLAVPHTLDDTGTLTDGTHQPCDGPITELDEHTDIPYCATPDCTNLIDNSPGYDGYCGSCADHREPHQNWA
ncbi:hypothetical protein ACWDUL_33625 [Nocardia niigatensis]